MPNNTICTSLIQNLALCDQGAESIDLVVCPPGTPLIILTLLDAVVLTGENIVAKERAKAAA